MRVWLAALLFALAGCGGGGGGSSGTTPPPAPPTNTAPTVSDATAVTQPGEALTGTLTGSDADNDALTFSISTQPTNGAVSLTGADYEYTPAGGFSGEDSFQFTANDGTADSSAGTVTITVNTRPGIAGPASTLETNELNPIQFAPTVSDTENDATTVSVSGQPTQGTITAFDPATGAFTYTPDPSGDGVDSVELTASDPFQDSTPVSFPIEVFNWMGNGVSGTSEDDFISTLSVAEAPDGGLIFGGGSNGSFGGGPTPAESRSILRRLDRRGNEAWTTELGDGTAQTSVRSVLRIGGSTEFLALEGGSGDLVRLDESGGVLWRQSPDFGTFQDSGQILTGYGATMDTDGNVYILHRALQDPNDTAFSLSAAVAKHRASDGQRLWQRVLRPSASGVAEPWIENSRVVNPFGITTDTNGDVYLTGLYTPETASAACSACNFIAKIDASGNDLWMRDEIGSTDTCYSGQTVFDEFSQLGRITVGNNGELYVIGFDSISLVPGDRDPTSISFVRRYSADGQNLEWTYCDNDSAEESFSFVPVQQTEDSSLLVLTSRETTATTAAGDADELFLGFVRLDTNGAVLNNADIRLQNGSAETLRLRSGSLLQGSDGLIYLAVNSDGVTGTEADQQFAIIRIDDQGNVQP
ncbi:MAG: Ig-like domain-containing protein [Pseudomonadota bacterium]